MTCSQAHFCLRVIGEGGIGKTTLACQLALWATEEERIKRLCPDRQMLPVIVEPGTSGDVRRDVSTFKNVVRGLLQDTLQLDTAIPESLFERLLRTRRVLVILDGLSEMDPGSSTPEEGRASPINIAFPAAALVVTSRREELLSQATHSDIYPLRIDRNHLSRFIGAYLYESGLDLKDTELFEACGRLSAMTDSERGITPLLARLYAAQVVRAIQEGRALEQLPRKIPDLMLEYLNYLNRNRKPGDPDDTFVHRASKLVAWECVRHALRPGRAKKAALVDAPQTTGDAGKLLDQEALRYLEETLRLLSTVPPAKTDIQFVLDPLAEYIAAIRLIEVCAGDENEWRHFFDRADALSGGWIEIRGFLVALRDCCEAKGAEYDVPHVVMDQINQRITTEPSG
jgi:hypothetical protein